MTQPHKPVTPNPAPAAGVGRGVDGGSGAGEGEVIRISDPFVVAGVRAYASANHESLEQAAADLIVERLTELGVAW